MKARMNLEEARRVHAVTVCPAPDVYQWIGQHLQLVRDPGPRVYEDARQTWLTCLNRDDGELAWLLTQAETARGVDACFAAAAVGQRLDRQEGWLAGLQRWWDRRETNWKYLTLRDWWWKDREALVVLLDELGYTEGDGVAAYARLVGGGRSSFYEMREKLRLLGPRGSRSRPCVG